MQLLLSQSTFPPQGVPLVPGGTHTFMMHAELGMQSAEVVHALRQALFKQR
jgi:hypothetical protein